MKLLLLLSSLFLLSISAENCGGKKNQDRLKGVLEIKALCMNYTIRLVEGSLDSSIITSAWTDEHTGKTYANVFGLANPCDFPASINQGDEFYFTIDSSQEKKDCVVCMAYYPTPQKKISIKVTPK